MSTTYNVIQPNNISQKLKSGSIEDRLETVGDLLSNWEDYCERNWISANHADMFCGENKVKRFLGGQTYFLLLGSTGDVVTDYKEIMNGKREIPISSCPSQIEDMVYGTGVALHPHSEDEEAAFKRMAAEPVTKKRSKTHMASEKELKFKQIRKDCGHDVSLTYCTVDTDNCFIFAGVTYAIDKSVEAYAPKHTPLGLLYDMDKIVCAKSRDGKVRFYTQKYDPIDEEKIFKK